METKLVELKIAGWGLESFSLTLYSSKQEGGACRVKIREGNALEQKPRIKQRSIGAGFVDSLHANLQRARVPCIPDETKGCDGTTYELTFLSGHEPSQLHLVAIHAQGLRTPCEVLQ